MSNHQLIVTIRATGQMNTFVIDGDDKLKLFEKLADIRAAYNKVVYTVTAVIV